MAWTSRGCRPQKSAIWSKVSEVLSTSHTAVALGISGERIEVPCANFRLGAIGRAICYRYNGLRVAIKAANDGWRGEDGRRRSAAGQETGAAEGFELAGDRRARGLHRRSRGRDRPQAQAPRRRRGAVQALGQENALMKLPLIAALIVVAAAGTARADA